MNMLLFIQLLSMMAVAAATAFGPTAATIKLDGRSLLHPHPQNDDDKNLVANKQFLNHQSFTRHHNHHAVVRTNNNSNNNNSNSNSNSNNSNNNNNKNKNKNKNKNRNNKNNKNNKNNNSNNNNLLSIMTATSAIGRIVPVKIGARHPPTLRIITGARPTTTTLRVITQQDDGDNVMAAQRLHDISFVCLNRRDTYQQHGFDIDIGRIVPVKIGARPTTLRIITQQDDDNNVMAAQRLHDNSFVRLDRHDTYQHGFDNDG